MRIALIHATPLAIEPVLAAFRTGWPEAAAVNILDDSLSADRAREGVLSERMHSRIGLLARYAVDDGARAVLFTCSAFGPAIERAARALPVPVLKPNEAMFEAALAAGARIGMVATFAPSIASMQAEFDEAAAGASHLEAVLAEGAMEALRAGDPATHHRLVAQAASRLRGVDAIMLAQFSMAGAAAEVRKRVQVPVLTSPDAAVEKLRLRLEKLPA